MHLEKRLVDAALSGDWVELSSGLPKMGQVGVSVDAALLRALMLGVLPLAPDERHGLRTQGIRLRGAILEGVLDLRDCAGNEGGPLPPLLLEKCIIAGDPTDANLAAIDARHACLSRLVLSGSRVGRIELTGASLAGDLEINDVAPIDDARPCQICASGSRIDGSVIAARANLRIPHGQRLGRFDVADYALELSNADVHGNVVLQPHFRADGGVNLGGAHVHGDIWGEGAHLIASEEMAFRAQMLRCEGVVALRGVKDNDKFLYCQAQGYLDFGGASLAYLDLRGIHVRRAPKLPAQSEGDRYALNLGHTNVRGDILLESLLDGAPPILEGSLYLGSANAGGNISLSGIELHVPPTFTSWSIAAVNLRVGGDLDLSGAKASIWIGGSSIGRDLTASAVVALSPDPGKQRYGLIASNVEIGNDCQLLNVSGSVDLELARIGGRLRVKGANLVEMNARDIDVRGSVELTGTVRQSRFDGGNYHGEFKLGAVSAPLELQEIGNKTARLSIDDARIERDLSVVA